MSATRRPFRRRVLEPLAVFFLLGGVLLITRSWFDAPGDSLPPATDEPQLVEIGTSEIEEITRRHTAQTGRPPSEAELAALLDAAADEEISVREALRLGLHEQDSVVRQRLVRNMKFLNRAAASGDPDAAEAAESEQDDEDLFRAALALGMHRTDLVVRRRLAERIRRRAIALADEQPISREQRQAWLDTHTEDFRIPEATTFTQIMIQRAAEHDSLGEEAKAILQRLIDEDIPPVESRELGISSLLPWHMDKRNDGEIAGAFGVEFARTLASMKPRRWTGPVTSSFGLHAVFIYDRTEARDAELADVDEAVRAAILESRRREAYGDYLAGLRSGYDVRIAPYSGVPASSDAAPLTVIERRSGRRKKQ